MEVERIQSAYESAIRRVDELAAQLKAAKVEARHTLAISAGEAIRVLIDQGRLPRTSWEEMQVISPEGDIFVCKHALPSSYQLRGKSGSVELSDKEFRAHIPNMQDEGTAKKCYQIWLESYVYIRVYTPHDPALMTALLRHSAGLADRPDTPQRSS